MNTFQNYVFVTTLFCLLVALTITAIVLVTSKKGTYPPSVDGCPDYWHNSYYNADNTKVSSCASSQFGCCPDNSTPKTDESGSTCPASKCYNVKKLGTVSNECSVEMDFTNYSTCQKQSWAKKCDITWDGITNVSNAC